MNVRCNTACDLDGMGCDHEMRGAVDRGQSGVGREFAKQRVGALHRRRTCTTANDEERNFEGGE